MAIVKSGECYYLDENGCLCLAESFLDTETQEATSTSTIISCPEPEPEPENPQ